MNNNPTDWESKKSDLIILTETWLEEGSNMDEYYLPDYDTNFNNRGRGKGIASYYNSKFKHAVNINSEGFSISKMESKVLDIIGVYRSQEGNVMDLISKLEALIDPGKTSVIGGDMNICGLAHPKNYVTTS